MECAGRHLVRRPCRGSVHIRCGACGAVRYCSTQHQRLHWPEHKHDCERFEQQMRRGVILDDFPFTFSDGSTSFINDGNLTICTFLESFGVHLSSFWRYECDCWRRPSSMSGFENREEAASSGWGLPSHLSPCIVVNNEVCEMQSWSDYYAWRQLPLHSPVAILLHWPLSLYHSLQLTCSRFPSKHRNDEGNNLRIYYLGPEKELDQIEVFGELCNLLQGRCIHIDFIGSGVSVERDQSVVQLTNPPKCTNTNCECKISSENTQMNGFISIKLWKGFYHDIYDEILRDSLPDFIFAANAGIAAFPSWIPTVELIIKIGVPAVFTDFCEEAAILACKCLESTFACPLTVPLQINPFRQPISPPNRVLDLPTYSNCFLFGIN